MVGSVRLSGWIGILVALSGCASTGLAPTRTEISAGTAVPDITSLAQAAPSLDTLSATLWTISAVEARATALQAYAAARISLDEALADPRWTAAQEQGSDYEHKPPAIIVDVDETVLDNSPYQRGRLLSGRRYDPSSWHSWCLEARAPAIPGAVDFARYATSRGVTIFYVTNRSAAVADATAENLRLAGFPFPTDREVLFTVDGRPEWVGPDKGLRRAEIAKDYRIVLLIGDDFGDFLSGVRVDPASRATLAARYAENWGREWIVLANPVYGSWWDALSGANVTDEVGVLERRREALQE